jgi:surface protein
LLTRRVLAACDAWCLLRCLDKKLSLVARAGESIFFALSLITNIAPPPAHTQTSTQLTLRSVAGSVAAAAPSPPRSCSCTLARSLARPPAHRFTGNVTTMNMLFYTKDNFNEDIGGWVTSKCTNMRGMFWRAAAFDQDISGWDTSKCTDMSRMFQQATAFDQDIGGWDVSAVGEDGLDAMFMAATAMNQDLSSWCVDDISNGEYGYYYEFGNAGADPNWGAACVTPCDTGADGTECQNGGAATGVTPDDSTVADTCSCTCTGESAAERASRAMRASRARGSERRKRGLALGSARMWAGQVQGAPP